MAQLVKASMEVFGDTGKKRKGRGYSQATLEALATLKNLRIGQARAWVVEEGENVAKLRIRLARAAKLSNLRLRYKVLEDRVIFTIKSRLNKKSKPAAGN